LATNVTIKGQVTLPKSVRETAGIKPGDRVEVRPRAGGGVIVERVRTVRRKDDVGARIDRAIADLRGQAIKPTTTTDEMMRLLRDDD
jgi:antitoxin PrlF